MSNILLGEFPGPVPMEEEVSTDLTDTGEQVMSSVEIAELCEKEHRNVLRDIRSVLGEAGISLLKFESSYLNSQNKAQPCYLLPRFERDLVVSGYSVKYRAAIIRRWHELEEKAKAQDVPTSYGQALIEAGKLALKKEEQDRLLEVQQPAHLT